jgi:DNA polymerase I-like protein with 3'-5' exonuclease and polymerase domains
MPKPRYQVKDSFKHPDGFKCLVIDLDMVAFSYVCQCENKEIRIPWSTKGLRKIKTITNPKYPIGSLFAFNGYKFLIQAYQNFHYVVNECDDFGLILNDVVELISFDQVGLRKATKKVSAIQKDIEKTKILRDSYQPDYANQEILNKDILLEDTEEYVKVLESTLDLSIDIETYGHNYQEGAFNPQTGEIRLVQVYLPQIDKIRVYDFYSSWEENESFIKVVEKLSDPHCRIFVQNASFEGKWFKNKFGIFMNNIVDTRILSQIYYAGLSRGFNSSGVRFPHTLKEIVARELGIFLDKENQSFDWFLPLTNNQINYAANDPKYTFLASIVLLNKCLAEGMEAVVKAELSSIPAFNNLNTTGLPTDKKTLEKLAKQRKEALKVLKKPWSDLDSNININSPKQLLNFLSNIKVIIENKDGEPATDNPSVTEFILRTTKSTNQYVYQSQIFYHQHLLKMLKNLLLYRSVKKDLEYIESYLKFYKQGRIFTFYNQNGDQASGRTTSGKPNAQNIPKLSRKKQQLGLENIRKAFSHSYLTSSYFLFALLKIDYLAFLWMIPYNKSMIIVDFNGSHSQIFGEVSGEPELKKAKEQGLKEHYITASGIFDAMGKPMDPWEIKKIHKDLTHELQPLVDEVYKASKVTYYGCLNLNGGTTLQSTFLKEADQLEEISTCKKYIKGWRSRYAVGYKFQLEAIRKANEHNLKFNLNTSKGFQNIGVSGAKLYAMSKSIDGGRLFVEKFPNNYTGIWEGKATDIVSFNWLRLEGTIIKKALGLIHAEFLKHPEWKAMIWQMTHDEVGCECSKRYELIVAEFVNRTMAECFIEWVPSYQPDSWEPESCLVNNWAEK